ncbi:Flp family type IVb pilin [Bacillus taeanensis]|nr:Flp family type IVb pilin [Bacillus taeanensis]
MNLLSKILEAVQAWMMSFLLIFKRLVNEEKGQGMVEYALILALIAIVLAASLPTLTDDVSALYTSDGSRRITNIAKVEGIENGIVVLQDLFVFEKASSYQSDKITGNFKKVGLLSKFNGNGWR